MVDFAEGLKRLAQDSHYGDSKHHEFNSWAYAAGHQHLSVEDFLLDLARKLEDLERKSSGPSIRRPDAQLEDDERKRGHQPWKPPGRFGKGIYTRTVGDPPDRRIYNADRNTVTSDYGSAEIPFGD